MSMPPPPPPPGSGSTPDSNPWPSPPGGTDPAGAPSAWTPAAPPPPQYLGVDAAAAPPARPAIPIQGAMIVGGAVLIVLGAFLPWLTGNGESVNAFDLGSFGDNESSRGAGLMFLAVVIGGLGLATYAFRRNLAVVIIATVFSALALLRGLADISDLNDLTNVFGASVGAGVYVATLGGAIALAGSIWGLTVRRR